MFKKYLSKLEAIIAWSQSIREAIYILIQYFSWYYFSICRYRLWVFIFSYIHQRNIKLSFINSLLPIAGLLLTVFVVKRFLGGSIEKELLKYYMLLLKYYSQKTDVCPNFTSSLTVGFRRISWSGKSHCSNGCCFWF
jgi:CIC family chloride channel protein